MDYVCERFSKALAVPVHESITIPGGTTGTNFKHLAFGVTIFVCCPGHC